MPKKQSNSLGALFYPKKIGNKPVPFESLYIPHIYKEIYFEGLYQDVTNQQEGMVIMDVGANLGIVTQYLRDHAKIVYAIEPSPEHFQALNANKTFNKWDNVEIFNMALADKDGEMTLSTLDSNRTCNSLVNDYGQGGHKVKTMAFDTFMEKNKIDGVDFVKFDVEGAEDLILRSEGFQKVAKRIKAIEVEMHYPSWPNLVEYMGSLGFKARRYDSSAIVILFLR